MRTIALVNQKGGVGKTTTAVQLAAALSSYGKRVLLVDLDPQANATLAFGVRPDSLPTNAYSVLVSKARAVDAIRPITNLLYLLPSSIDLAGAEMELCNEIGRERVLADAMSEVTDFDFVLVDCPPSLGLLSVNALTYVREVFIPVQCEFFALHGLSLLLRTVDLVQRRLNPELEVTGVVACMFDGRRSLSRETLLEIQSHFGNRVFETRIRNNVRLAEAPSHGQSVFEYAPESYGASDYFSLAREVLGLAVEDSAVA